MKRTAAGIMIAFFASTALAHGAGSHAKGTVKSISSERIVMESQEGEKEFKLTPQTEFVKGGAIVTAKELRPGDRVIVHGKGAEAIQVRAGGETPHGHGR